MRSKAYLIIAGGLMSAALLTGCDRSAQNADGATGAGELGVAATTANTGVIADTGADTGASNMDIGGAGELGTGGSAATTENTTAQP